ncbi:hypothetical protein EBZ80_26025 [bacterium]|nr:hypothetical protein [bacterium]
MTDDKITAASGVRGHITLWQVDDKTGLKVPVGSQPNQIQYSWGFIAAKQIGYRPNPERLNYNISAVYLEFENQADPEVPVSVVQPNRAEGINYYNALINNYSRDFLRVPLIIEPTGSVSAGYEANLPTEQQLNKLTFFVQSAGTVGVHGRQFSHAASGGTSKVYAAALVAAPVFSDRTRDVVFARTVFTEANQVTKEASSQIGLTWEIAFE